MPYSITDLKNDLAGIVHGTTLNQITNVNGVIDRAGRKLLEDVDAFETIRIVPIVNALYDEVYDYQAPSDLKGDRIIDLRPQVNRSMRDRFFQFYNEEFDMQKAFIGGTSIFSVQNNGATKSLRIAKNLIAGTLVNLADGVTTNGTWTTGGTATNISTDGLNYVAGSGSVRFDLGAGANPSTGFVENSTIAAVDLTRDLNIGALFLFVYIPNPLVTTAVNLRWGSSAADYWSVTVNTAQPANAFQVGWNLLRFDWANAAVVGAPIVTAVNYARLSLTYDGVAAFACRINNLVSHLGSIYEIEYYSKFLFRDSLTDAFQEKVTADTNIVNLDVDGANLLTWLTAYYAVQQQQGMHGDSDAKFFWGQYKDSKEQYTNKYKSQIIPPQQSYYPLPRMRYRGYGRGNR